VQKGRNPALKKNISRQSKTAKGKTTKKPTLQEIQALSKTEELTVGIDIGDRWSRYCVVNSDGDTILEGKLATTREDLSLGFKSFGTTTMALEAGTHSPWISRLLTGLGHDVVVANPRRVALIGQSSRKNDKVDAAKLAMLAQTNQRLLYPIQHRGEQAQADLAMIRAREELVKSRTALINAARGQAKAIGYRLESCDADAVKPGMADVLPITLRGSVKLLLETAALLTAQIKAADQQIHTIAERYPEISLLTPIWGVGELTALAFQLTIDDKDRFGKSREVGPYLGIVPGQDQSGEADPQQRITKEGDRMVRWLLVQCAHCILKKNAPDSDLKRWGQQKIDDQVKGGKKPNKKKVLVGIARKLAVLMHRLWANGEVYDPLYNAKKQEALAAKRKKAA
jgi:transposase